MNTKSRAPRHTTDALIRIFFLAVILLVLVTLPLGVWGEDAADAPDMALVTESPHDYAETVERFKEEAETAGWSILHVNNMAGVLSARGYTLDPVQILDVCSGRYSVQILEKDEFRPVSAFMPCRVSIYKTSDGGVFISRMNVPAFLGMMPEEVADVMEASSEEIEEIIERTVAE